MTPEERWERAQDLLEEALERLPEDRADFLDEACSDPGLRDEVLSLLGYSGSTTTFVDRPAAGIASPEELAPRQIGSYRLVRPLGRGGMGSVHLAVRSDGVYRKPVALKLLQRGLGGEDMERRFRHEREILADLEHPLIARLLDGGTHEGRPYLVMEYVDGLPIDRFCSQNQLNLRQRLRLVRRVCEAIQFAHQNLVVHRDIKPSNLLVTADGTPKLLDFGIAKLLRDDDFPHTVVATLPGRSPMTPAYASPEQVRGLPVSTATDVYSLGILLYELLTGRRPYEIQGATPGEIERIICESAPPRPSTVLDQRPEISRIGAPEGDLPRHRRRLRRSLSGDLDNIVLMALRKEPQRRYVSAEQLGLDIERYLEGLPVSAHRDTFRYRMGKFVGRNRVAVGITLLAFLTLIGFVLLLLDQQAALRAESNRYQFTSEFLGDLFTQADPWASGAETLSLRDVLDRGAREIRERPEDPPEVRADLLLAMGRSYLNLGEYETARPLLEEGLALRQTLYRGDHRLVARALYQVAQIETDTGHYERAQTLVRESLGIYQQNTREEDTELAEVTLYLARLLDLRGRYQQADTTYQEALRLSRLLEEPELLAKGLDLYGLLLARQAAYNRAGPYLEEALALRRRTLGETHPRVAFTLLNLARLARDLFDYERAEGLLCQAESIQRAAFGDRHPHVAGTLGSHGVVLHHQGRYDEAEKLLEEAVAIRRTVHSQTPALAGTLTSLAHLHIDMGQLDKALTEAREALELDRSLLEPGHADIAYALDALGLASFDAGDFDTARSSLEEALGIYRNAFGEAHPRTAAALENLALLAYQKNDLETAEDLFRQSLASYRAVHGDQHHKVGILHNNLGLLLRRSGDLEGARDLYLEALDIARQTLPPGDPNLGLSLNNLGRVEWNLGELDDAERHVREAIEIFDTALEDNHRWRRTSRRVLAQILTAQERFEEAEGLLVEQRRWLETERGLEDKETLLVLRQLTKLYRAWGRDDLLRTMPKSILESLDS